ncbi:MAG: ATP synthase F0 subunit C [Bacilli bacterium]
MEPFIGAAIAILGAFPSAIGEAWVISSAINGMSRNPDMAKTLRSSMIMGAALVETTAIYSLLMSILILFVG